MMKKIQYPFALIILILGCWFSAILFGGLLNPGTLITLVIVVILIAFLLTSVTLRVSHRIWIFASLFILVALYLPTSFYIKLFPPGDAEPFSASIALTILIIISAALIVAALLINSGLMSYQDRQNSYQDKNGGSIELWVVFTLSLLLLVKAIHNFYWFMIWDSTTDSLGIIWLSVSVWAVIFSSFTLIFTRSGMSKTIGYLNLLLIPVLIVIFAQMGEFRQLTEARAEHVSRAIESYYAQTGQYPEDLRQLTPRYLLSIPAPVIIYGQDWCYNGGKDYYRLGYVDRQHWSDPRLIGQIYITKGELPDLPPMCQAEVTVIQNRYPDYPYEYMVDGK